MKQKLTLIALRTTKVNDRTSILWAYSDELGRLSFALNAGSGREACRRRALLMPLSVVECEADVRPGRDINFMSQPRGILTMDRVYSHPVKNAIAMFLSEFLSIVLKETMPDPGRFSFIVDSINLLTELSDNHAIANFHICFMLRAGRFLGIEPDYSSYAPGRVFDMTDGIFKAPFSATLNHTLTPEESKALVMLGRMTYSNMGVFRLGRTLRNRILELIIEFYSIHLTSLSSMKSLEVLRTLF